MILRAPCEVESPLSAVIDKWQMPLIELKKKDLIYLFSIRLIPELFFFFLSFLFLSY